MRRIHLLVGILGVVAFVLTGQVMAHHVPEMQSVPAEFRMMYVSRHIYLLGASLVNLSLGLYLQLRAPGWRRVVQQVGSVLILLSVVALLFAFLREPALGVAGRSWRSFFGLIGLFAGVLAHVVSVIGNRERGTAN